MAIPITSVHTKPESRSEIQVHLDTARIAHAKAILSAYELLQQLHDAHVLDILRSALDAGDTIVTKLAVASTAPEAIGAVRNLVSLARILGSVDPDVLHSLADELTSKKPKETVAPPPRIWAAVKMLASSDSRRALVGTAAFLQAFGRALRKGKTKR